MHDVQKSNSQVNPMRGWEEAGAEFYQEQFPMGWERIKKNRTAIHTLLPSKQNRSCKY